MKRKTISVTLVFFFLSGVSLSGQIYFTKSGKISFESETPLEKIEAVNAKAVSILNLDDHTLEFSVLIKGFYFPNALMQTHFNENYLLSDEYPKATFKSAPNQFEVIDLQIDSTYEVPVLGTLNVKGVDKEIESIATLQVDQGIIRGQASFVVSPADFQIEIPNLVKDKIAKEIHVKVDAEYEIYNKK